MDKEQFGRQFKRLKGAYPHRFIPVSSAEDMVNILLTYYDFLKEYDESVFEKVVSDWIRNNGNAPSISDLVDCCKKETDNTVKYGFDGKPIGDGRQ